MKLKRELSLGGVVIVVIEAMTKLLKYEQRVFIKHCFIVGQRTKFSTKFSIHPVALLDLMLVLNLVAQVLNLVS